MKKLFLTTLFLSISLLGNSNTYYGKSNKNIKNSVPQNNKINNDISGKWICDTKETIKQHSNKPTVNMIKLLTGSIKDIILQIKGNKASTIHTYEGKAIAMAAKISNKSGTLHINLLNTIYKITKSSKGNLILENKAYKLIFKKK